MLLSFDPSTFTIRTGIRELISFGWLPERLFRQPGDVPLQARQAMHSAFQRASSGTGTSREVPVSLEERVGRYTFRIAGRIDLLTETRGGLTVTEVKTALGLAEDLDPVVAFPEAVLQLYFYVLALASEDPGREIAARLVFLDMASSPPSRRVFEPDPADPRIRSSWNDLLAGVAEWMDSELEIRGRQRLALRDLRIPFDLPRPGQDEMARLASEALRFRGSALMEAPTGTGKTAAVLAGALPVSLGDGLTLFFLTAKDTQKRIASETLRRFLEKGLPLRAVSITAREKSCPIGPGRCLEDECPLAQHFGSGIRRDGTIGKLLERGVVEPDQVAEAAARAGVCPFELTLVLAMRCDVVVCDYNYAFDPHVYLRRFFLDPASAEGCALLVDEAANLPQRAREYYSPEMRASWLEALRPLPGQLRRFARLLAPWRRIMREWDSPPEDGAVEWELPSNTELPLAEDAWRRGLENLDTRPPEELVRVFLSIVDFSRIASARDSRFNLLYRREQDDRVLQWLCTDASAFLAERFQACAGAVAFSATLKPLSHFRQELGMPPETALVEMPYPFPPDRLGVWIDPRVDTRYSSRRATLEALRTRISAVYHSCPGTYIVFFPSYEYLSMAAAAMASADLPVMVQKPSMSMQDRSDFLARLESSDNLVLTVSGGIFAEGVDLRAPNRRGAVVVGPCLPAPELRNRLLAERYDSLGEDGFLHAAVIPGMNRVIQAAGRLIRGPGDRGVLILVDRRFGREPFLGLLPRHWFRNGSIPLLGDAAAELSEFWRSDRSGEAPRR